MEGLVKLFDTFLRYVLPRVVHPNFYRTDNELLKATIVSLVRREEKLKERKKKERKIKRKEKKGRKGKKTCLRAAP